MIHNSALRSARTLFALVAFTAMISTAAACSSDSDAGDTPAVDTTTTVPMGGIDSDDSSSDPPVNDPTPADDIDEDSDAGGDGSDDGSSQKDSLPGDFPAIPLPEYDKVDVMGTGQMGSGKYSGRATFTIDAYRDKPLAEMIDAYSAVLVNAGFSPLELDDEGSRIRGWSTQGDGDNENQVDITVYKDRPGDLEIGGAHWEAIGL